MSLFRARLLVAFALASYALVGAARLSNQLRGVRTHNGTASATATSKEVMVSAQNKTEQAPAATAGGTTFETWYKHVTTGRGVWKWSNALTAYDRHLLPQFQNKPVVGAEVGVQSGGSILMWHQVLGAQSVIHGLDINPACARFVGPKTSITLGDQGDPEMWKSFFTKVTPSLDFLVDDGGHFPDQMLTTTYAVFPKLKPAGVLAIEDIHGAHYYQSFFQPLAQYLGAPAQAPMVASVHMYPYMVVIQKQGPGFTLYDPTLLPEAKISATGRISTVEEILPAVEEAPPGTLVVLENPSWGNFITANGLTYFFRDFNGLNQPQSMPDNPPGCASTSAPVCTSGTVNSHLQAKVIGVHVLPTKFVVEVASRPPVIEAVRHGDQWVRRPENEEIPERLQKALKDSTVPAHHILPGTPPDQV